MGLGFLSCSFSSSFRCRVRLCTWDLSCFLRKACITIYFPLRTAFAMSYRFWIVVFSFSFVSMNFFSSSLISWLIHSFFRRMLFSLHVFGFFPNFLLWLSSSFRALWSENMQGMISIFWYQLRPDLWPRMWSILENVPCALEKNVYSVALGWNVLNISVMSIWCVI